MSNHRAGAGSHACIYGPLRDLPTCLVKESTTATRSDTRLEFTAQQSKDSWRLFRVRTSLGFEHFFKQRGYHLPSLKEDEAV